MDLYAKFVFPLLLLLMLYTSTTVMVDMRLEGRRQGRRQDVGEVEPRQQGRRQDVGEVELVDVSRDVGRTWLKLNRCTPAVNTRDTPGLVLYTPPFSSRVSSRADKHPQQRDSKQSWA